MPPKTETSSTSDQQQKQEQEMIWKDCSLGSVPINIIKFCLYKANLTNNKTIPKRVTVHLSHGNNIRYRTDNLVSIDESMNMRLQNVVVSRVKREATRVKELQNMTVTARTVGNSNSSSSKNKTNSNNNTNTTGISIPFDEQLMETKKDILLPGSSVSLIELPEEWSGIFEEQAKEVRKEYYRRERAINFMKKEERKKKIEAALDRKKAKKEKIAKKEALMKKGVKRGK